MHRTIAYRRMFLAAGVLAAMTLLTLGSVAAQAAMTVSKLRLGSVRGAENYLFTAGDQIVAQGIVDAGTHYRFVVTDPSGAVRATSACRLSPANGSVTNGYLLQSGDPVSASTA